MLSVQPQGIEFIAEVRMPQNRLRWLPMWSIGLERALKARDAAYARDCRGNRRFSASVFKSPKVRSAEDRAVPNPRHRCPGKAAFAARQQRIQRLRTYSVQLEIGIDRLFFAPET